MAHSKLKDSGPRPYVVDIEEATVKNQNFRTALWSGGNLQLTLMSIPVGGEIGLEAHSELDQFLRIEQGRGLVQMGQSIDALDFEEQIGDNWVVLVPAGMWHNITNVGDTPLKIYSIYAPPEHPHGTIHATKAESDAAEGHDH